MDNDSKFWLGVWLIAGTVLCTIVASSQAYYAKETAVLANALSKSVDPIGMRCAMSDTLGDNPTCVISTLKEK